MDASSGDRAWRTLEVLVSRLERLLEGEDVEIRSPDRIRDRDTGRYREVDVSVRRRIGSVEVLIIFECRRRDAPADVRWIEQLATKASGVGAHVAVAVSATGFTSGAVDKAAAKGIELRTVDEVDEQDVARWMGWVVYDYQLVSLGVRVGTTTPGSNVTMRLDGRNFVRISDGSELTMFEAFPLTAVLQQAANQVPLSRPREVCIDIVVPAALIGVRTDEGILPVTRVRIQANVERRLAHGSSAAYAYAPVGGAALAAGLEVRLEGAGTSVVIDYMRGGTPDQRASMTARRDDHDDSRIVQVDLALVDEAGNVEMLASEVVRSATPTSARRRRRPEPPATESGRPVGQEP